VLLLIRSIEQYLRIIMALCGVCFKVVRGKQQALQCDACSIWTHRKCGTRITQTVYRRMARMSEEWVCRCPVCSEVSRVGPPVFESMHLEVQAGTKR